MSTICDISSANMHHSELGYRIDRKEDTRRAYDIISQTSGEERRRQWVRFFERESYRQYYLLWKSRQFSETQVSNDN
ncbi:hypothetical protein ElyMa_002833700 [Elysia marginata]|uniref:PH domain-containing protein n=1 Tax=Elysia marginata TaxID=1093978 RepID=A0AAV4HTQ3_9GAST|nr:hypothetical protein ElyMa_002833700 [Elysia marginata]